MANAVYEKGFDNLLRGNIDVINNTVGAVLVDLNDYTPNIAADELLSAVPAAARVETVAITGVSTDGQGTMDANDPTFANATGDTAEAVVIYAGDGTSNRLLLFYDSCPGLPVTPNTGDILVQISAAGLLTLENA